MQSTGPIEAWGPVGLVVALVDHQKTAQREERGCVVSEEVEKSGQGEHFQMVR